MKAQVINMNTQKSLNNIRQNVKVASNKKLLSNIPPPPPTNPPPPLPINTPSHTIPSNYNYLVNNTTKQNNEVPKISRTPSHIKKQRLQNEFKQNSSSSKNSYTLFPSDSMLKKSLPRRNKKSISHLKELSLPTTNTKEKESGINKNIETNI